MTLRVHRVIFANGNARSLDRASRCDSIRDFQTHVCFAISWKPPVKSLATIVFLLLPTHFFLALDHEQDKGAVVTSTNRFDAYLQRALAEGSDQPLHVVIRLKASANDDAKRARREDRVATLQERFQSDVKPIVDRLAAAGASNVQLLWIARAVSAVLDRKTIVAIGQLEGVERIELVRPMQALTEREHNGEGDR
jgi:hypothetical protein